MISALLILGALTAGVVIAVFWKKILNWLKAAYDKIKEVLHIAVIGTEVFLKRCSEGFQELSHHYSRTPDNQWRKDTVIKQEFVDESEIPDDIKALAEKTVLNETLNITVQLQEQVMTLQS